MRSVVRSALLAFACFVAAACGREPNAPPPPAGPPPPSRPVESDPAGGRTLKRSDVKRASEAGVGAFLQKVTLDENPVMDGEKFHGFRIRRINASWPIDLRPGDVVTRVNGMPIEKPEDAHAVMKALATAPALRVDYERDGKPRLLEIPIVDE